MNHFNFNDRLSRFPPPEGRVAPNNSPTQPRYHSSSSPFSMFGLDLNPSEHPTRVFTVPSSSSSSSTVSSMPQNENPFATHRTMSSDSECSLLRLDNQPPPRSLYEKLVVQSVPRSINGLQSTMLELNDKVSVLTERITELVDEQQHQRDGEMNRRWWDGLDLRSLRWLVLFGVLLQLLFGIWTLWCLGTMSWRWDIVYTIV